MVKSREVIRYDAQLASTIAAAATTPIMTVKETSGPPGPLIPRSRVCCTAIGTTTWPVAARNASAIVPARPSFSSGETRTPRRIVSIAPMSSPVSIVGAQCRSWASDQLAVPASVS